MRTLILYATKSGASKECAELLSRKIQDCTVCDAVKNIPNITSFDTIIIGSGVRIGKFYKPVRNFIQKNIDLLLTKKIAFYLCNAYPDTLQKAIKKNIPEKLIQHAVCVKSFSGKPPFTNPQNTDWIDIGNINDFIDIVF